MYAHAPAFNAVGMHPDIHPDKLLLIMAGGVGPMARLKATVSMLQQQQQPAVPSTGKLLRHVPARSPPSPQAINEWLRAESLSHAEAAASSAAAAAQAAAGSGFIMDANTGRLVPLQSSATQVILTARMTSSKFGGLADRFISTNGDLCLQFDCTISALCGRMQSQLYDLSDAQSHKACQH